MKKNIGIWVCIIFFVIGIGSNSSNINGLETSYQIEADRLNDLGLFKGTKIGYELEAKATRAQGAVMLVRFMGFEAAAIKGYDTGGLIHPFTDVPKWAAPHVAYLYNEGLVNGVSETVYAADKDITGEEYITMLLRMLGYDDENNEFRWNNSLEFLSQKYFIESYVLNNIRLFEKKGITRGMLVKLSYMTLEFSYKSTVDTLIPNTVFEKLYFGEVISETNYNKYKDILDEFSEKKEKEKEEKISEIRGVWFSYLELKPMLLNNNATQFRINISESFQKIADDGFNTVYIQVRPFSDAIYKSNIYPWSSIITGTQGLDPGFDPLEICIEEAKSRNLRIEAWINPYRVRTDVSIIPISSESSIGRLIKENPRTVFQVGNLVTLNPAYEEVQDMIVKGVEEIVKNYDVDGIQFDDYFYPNGDFSLDKVEYDIYIKSYGDMSQGEFRRLQVTDLIEKVYNSIKVIDNNIEFGVSPQGNMTNNYELVFIDIKEWIKTKIVDYLAPQVYYGFDHGTQPFNDNINEWNQLLNGTGIDLIIGLSAYKIGQEDKWAGDGRYEWINNSNILSEMIVASRAISEYKGISIFRYYSLYKPLENYKEQVEKELLGLHNLFE